MRAPVLLTPAVLLFCGVPYSADAANAPERLIAFAQTAGEAKALGCMIQCEPISLLHRTPKIKVTITNQVNRDIYLVKTPGASAEEPRHSACYFEAIGPNGRPPDREVSGVRMISVTLRQDDFVRVAPGGTFDPYQHADHDRSLLAEQLPARYFSAPGEYRITFLYSTVSRGTHDWLVEGVRGAFMNKELLSMVARVPRVEVRSNEVRITVLTARPGWPTLFLDRPAEYVPRPQCRSR